jgi:hypothetical protein
MTVAWRDGAAILDDHRAALLTRVNESATINASELPPNGSSS